MATVTHLQAAAVVVTSRKKTFAACWYFRVPISVSGWLRINSLSIWLTDRKNQTGISFSSLSHSSAGKPEAHRPRGTCGATAAPGSSPLPRVSSVDHPFTLVRAEPTLQHRGHRCQKTPLSSGQQSRRPPARASGTAPASRWRCGARGAAHLGTCRPHASPGRRVSAELRPPQLPSKHRADPFPAAEAWRGRETFPSDGAERGGSGERGEAGLRRGRRGPGHVGRAGPAQGSVPAARPALYRGLSEQDAYC